MDNLSAIALERLVAVAALQSHAVGKHPLTWCARAARVLGFVNARLSGSPRDRLEQREYDRVLAVLHDAIGTDVVATLIAEGAAMTEEEAVDEALHAP